LILKIMTDKAKAFFDACAEGRHLEVQEALREASDAQTHTLLDQDVPFKPAGYDWELKLKPLHVAAWRGHGEVVELLVDKGANLDAQDKLGWTALQRAADNGHGEVVKLLVEKGANLEAQDTYGRTALHLAAQGGHGEVVKLLVEKGANLEAQDTYGRTALHLAAQGGHGEVVKLLVEKVGAVYDAQGTGGRTVLRTVLGEVAKVESQVARVESQVGELKAQGGKLEAMVAQLLEAQGLATPTPAMEESVTKEEGDGTGGLAPAGVDETKSSS